MKAIEDWKTIKHFEKYSEKRPTLNYEKFNTDKLTLVLIGDEHIGSKFYNADLHKKFLDWIYKYNKPNNLIRIILMGDEVETATKTSVGAGVYEQSEILEEQMEHFNKIYKPFADENIILGQHIGNHEQRIYNSSGLNITKMMAEQLGIKYFGFGKLHNIKVGKENYTIYTTHGSSGARLPHTKIKGVLDLANMVEAEIYAMGHLHQLSHHIRNYYIINKRNKTVEESQKHFILTGSYLNHWGSYAHMKGYEPMRKGSPKIKLKSKIHSIRVSL